jgi:hypothetical protein
MTDYPPAFSPGGFLLKAAFTFGYLFLNLAQVDAVRRNLTS